MQAREAHIRNGFAVGIGNARGAPGIWGSNYAMAPVFVAGIKCRIALKRLWPEVAA